MSVAEELRAYLIGQGVTDDAHSKVSRMPANGQLEIGEGQLIVVQEPGSISGGNLVQWKHTHNMLVIYRHKSGDELYNKDDEVKAAINRCVTLPSYRVLRARCGSGGELPLEAQEVHVMQWAATLELVTK